jgi:hypothetical protein
MTKEELINKIWDCYIDIHNSCGMITDEEAMQKGIKMLDEYELSKLHQPTVIDPLLNKCTCWGGNTDCFSGNCTVCGNRKGNGL